MTNPSPRRLHVEQLEARQLLASDLAGHLPEYSAATRYLDANCDARISEHEVAAASHLWSADVKITTTADASALSQTDGGNLAAAAQGGRAKPAYQYWITGNSRDVTGTRDSGLALIGGGSDVEEAFRWMGAKAHGGDFLVLTASSNGIYNNYISRLVPELDSVETLQIPNATAANSDFVVDRISKADAIFITGGDQSKYVNFWDETRVEDEIYAALARGVPLGGTSAGLAVLGDFDFSAVVDTISSAEALSDPYHPAITLDGDFLSNREFLSEESPLGSPLAYLSDTITDSHFQQRDRLGRLVTFMARLDADGDIVGDMSRAIGINEQTALLVDGNGMARIIGNPYVKNVDDSQEQRSVYFLSRSNTLSGELDAPLNYDNVQVARATYDPITTTGDTFDLANWEGIGVETYFVSAIDGVLSSNSTSIYGNSA